MTMNQPTAPQEDRLAIQPRDTPNKTRSLLPKAGRKTSRALAIALIAATFATTLAGAQGGQPGDREEKSGQRWVSESVEVSDHHVFNTSDRVDGATVLVRDFEAGVVTASITSRALEPDTAYSIWWAIFNRPQFCKTPFACGVTDLEVFGGDPRVRASVFWAGGFASDQFGFANSELRLRTGKTRRELFAKSLPWGLANIRNAEIHVVLRSHGPTGVAGTVAEQVGTATVACPEVGCFNAFASIHVAN